ncbi:MAG: hypothetical protein ABFD76_05235 [Smithella sp.]
MTKKTGIILIITGIFLHIISIPYMTGYNHHAGYFASIPYMKIVTEKEGYSEQVIKEFFPEKLELKNQKGIEYKHIIAFTSTLIFLGILIIILSSKKKS